MPGHLSLVESVILGPYEAGEMLGRMLDGSVEKLHADTWGGLVSEFVLADDAVDISSEGHASGGLHPRFC